MLTILWLGTALATGPAMPDASAAWPERTLQVQMTTQPATVDHLWSVLKIEPQMQIFQQEAVSEAARLDADNMIAGTGRPWAATVGDIHDPMRLQTLFRQGLTRALDRADPALIEQGLRFYETGLGRRMVPLETSARHAMLSDEVTAQASAAFAQAEFQDDSRAEQILRLIDVADLVAPNVSSGLNASVAFSDGFEAVGGFDMPLTQDQMLAETWAQQDQIEAETRDWLQSFLMMAYSPLRDDEVETYISFASSPAGRELARVMFAAYDTVFLQTSRDMGMAAGLRLQGQQL
ncbi:hypothetical protein [Paracoccus sp. R86501]|uniref:hypothetical protein n=1 Tax=Paracoccus sp. R86501 TaxID=3101711 RepID=UPI0036711DD0